MIGTTQGGDAVFGAALLQLVNNGSMLNQNISKLIETLSGVLPFSGAIGTLTLAASATTTVNNASVAANSFVAWAPTNAAAANVDAGAKALYLSARTAGSSFALTTADGTAAAGTETFVYVIINV